MVKDMTEKKTYGFFRIAQAFGLSLQIQTK